MNTKFKMAKIDPVFAKKIEDTALKKLQNGTIKKFDKEMVSVRRFTRAMANYQPLWKVLENAEFLEDVK